MSEYCYLNGKIILVNEASLSVKDLGILRGFAVFDFLRIQNKNPIFLDAHLNRFENSANSLGLKIPITRKEIESVLQELLKKNDLDNATARLVLTGGNSEDSLSFDPNSPTFFILVKNLPKYPAAIYKEGVKLMTYEHQRERPEAKSSNYITLLGLTKRKKEIGAFEVLYTSNGKILEGATCNFFLFKGDTLVTPKDNILLGTRRAIILKLAEKKFKIEIRNVKTEEITEAKEAFISSVTRDIVPVVKVDNTQIGSGKVGPNTKYLMESLAKVIESEALKQGVILKG